jgi:hypothetical protein
VLHYFLKCSLVFRFGHMTIRLTQRLENILCAATQFQGGGGRVIAGIASALHAGYVEFALRSSHTYSDHNVVRFILRLPNRIGVLSPADRRDWLQNWATILDYVRVSKTELSPG